MTMILKKGFTSFNYRLFVLPAFTRAFLIKGSPHGELSYNIKNSHYREFNLHNGYMYFYSIIILNVGET